MNRKFEKNFSIQVFPEAIYKKIREKKVRII